MKKTILAVSTILAMSSCTKEEFVPLQEQHNAHVKVSTHNQTWMVAYAVNIASIPSIYDINGSYEFYAELENGETVCCNVESPTFHHRVSVDLTEIGYMDLVKGFYVEADGIKYELEIKEIY